MWRTITNQKSKTEGSDHEDANSLAELLGNLPLALQQAVGFISSRHCSIDDYLTRWKSTDSRVLEWHNEATLKYTRSVATTWELTFDALKPEGQEALRIICWLAPDPIPSPPTGRLLPSKDDSAYLPIGFDHDWVGCEHGSQTSAAKVILDFLWEPSIVVGQIQGRRGHWENRTISHSSSG